MGCESRAKLLRSRATGSRIFIVRERDRMTVSDAPLQAC